MAHWLESQAALREVVSAGGERLASPSHVKEYGQLSYLPDSNTHLFCIKSAFKFACALQS